MNLISCNNCAVVCDADKLDFPEDIYDSAGCVDAQSAEWDGENYVPFGLCPVCKGRIRKPLEKGGR